MNTTQTTEYQVHLSHHATNGTAVWKAFVESLPQITAEGATWDEVLEEIGRKMMQRLESGESVAASSIAPTPVGESLSPEELAKLEEQVKAMGHKYYGIFANDPGALEVFDEIERQRDQHTIGG